MKKEIDKTKTPNNYTHIQSFFSTTHTHTLKLASIHTRNSPTINTNLREKKKKKGKGGETNREGGGGQGDTESGGGEKGFDEKKKQKSM